MDNLQDRQDVPIWNAIEAKNYKQALKLVDKRLLKKPTDYLEALKLYVQAHLPQISDRSVVVLYLTELSKRKVAVTDLAAIELCEDALDEVLPRTRETWQTWANIIGEIRWQCVKATPKNEDTSLKCLEACLSNNDLDHARQIANSLEKSFPKNRSYVFWNIMSMFLFATSPQCPENQKRIWGGLAHGQISKLALATKQATDTKQLPSRSIHTPQELLLLDRITASFGRPGQRLEYIQDPNLGPESTVAKGDWSLWILKLQLMREERQWQDIFSLCGSLLTRARTANNTDQLPEGAFSDWLIWKTMLDSASHLERSSCYDQIQSEVSAHLASTCKLDKSWKRNASLAQVKLVFDNLSAASLGQSASNGDSSKITPRLNAIVNYLEKYGGANTVYNDLRQFVEVLHLDERTQLLSILDKYMSTSYPPTSIDDSESGTQKNVEPNPLSTMDQIAQAINNLKFRYLLTCSLPENERRQNLASQKESQCTTCTSKCATFCPTCLLKLAQQSLAAYGEAMGDDGNITKSLLVTDRHPADDFCILAAMCLIKLGLMDSSAAANHLKSLRSTYLLQATALLEAAWTRSKSDFQISLLLVRLYKHIGCGSLAMGAYERLSLKEIQLDTLSYTILDRMSSLHPHPFNEMLDESSGIEAMAHQVRKQQKLYKSARGHIHRNIWLSYKHGSYNSIFEFNEVSHKLTHSLSAVMSVIESNKVQRFSKNTVGSEAILRMHELIPAAIDNQEPALSDNNDYETYPNYESSRAPGFEELSRFIPGATEYRYRQSVLAEKVMLIIDPSPELSGEREILQRTLKGYLDSQKQYWASKVGDKSLTRPEQSANHAYQLMALIIAESCDQELWLEGDFKTRLETHNKDLCARLEEEIELLEELPSLVPAFQDTLHAIYIAYEIARTAVSFCVYVSGKGKAVHESQGAAGKAINEVARRLIESVVAKCAVIKKGLDDGGWIDKVLESVFPDELPGCSSAWVEGVREILDEGLILDEGFMERWAGEVVESWKESAIGFSYIKMPAKA